MVLVDFCRFRGLMAKVKVKVKLKVTLTLKPNFSIVRNFVSCFILYLSSAEPWDPSLPLLCWGQ